jgi:Flp pilus assembly protein CpaB
VTKGRWLIVVAVILATLATAGVLLYDRGVDYLPKTGSMVTVTVFEVDVPAGTDLDQLIKNDQLRLIEIPHDAVIDGAVISVDQLRHRRDAVAILAGEQIPVSRLKIEAERDRSALEVER